MSWHMSVAQAPQEVHAESGKRIGAIKTMRKTADRKTSNLYSPSYSVVS